jgi:hypothetical protein
MNKDIFMYKKLSTKVIWVDFKTKRIFDLANLGHLDKSAQPIPWLCQKDRIKEKKNGHR